MRRGTSSTVTAAGQGQKRPTLQDYDAIEARNGIVGGLDGNRDHADVEQLEQRVKSHIEIPIDSCIPHNDEENTNGFSTRREGARCSISPSLGLFRFVLALDIASSEKRDDADENAAQTAVASGVLYDAQEGHSICEYSLVGRLSFPYVPGYLAFREVPMLARVVEHILQSETFVSKLSSSKKAMALLCDGHGIAHPRLCGLACHLGAIFDLPSVGVAKSHFVGTADDLSAAGHNVTLEAQQVTQSAVRKDLVALLGDARGSALFLNVDGHRHAGVILRTIDRVKPLYLSPGHGVSVRQAAEIVLHLCDRGLRQPQPMRLADQLCGASLQRQNAG